MRMAGRSAGAGSGFQGRDQTAINPDLVATRFGLTQAEARVAVMLAEGRSVA